MERNSFQGKGVMSGGAGDRKTGCEEKDISKDLKSERCEKHVRRKLREEKGDEKRKTNQAISVSKEVMIEERNGKKKRWQEKELIRPRSAETR